MSNPTELSDLDKLEALARAATPGPWTYFPKQKYNEHHVSLTIEGAGMRRALFDDGCRTDRPEADAQFIAAANPEQLLALIALARRAQPEGEAPHWGPVRTVGDLVRNLMVLEQDASIVTAFHVDLEGKRRCRAQQGITISRERVIDGRWIDSSRKDVPHAYVLWAKPDERALAATLSPLCGAQHAQSGKESAQLNIGFANNDQGVHVSVMQQHADGAVTLLHQAKVPAGDSFTRFAVAAQQAAAPGALDDDAAEGIELLDTLTDNIVKGGNYSAEATLTYLSQIRQCFAAPANSPEIPDGSLINEGTSAPGTPEAPKGGVA